MVTLSLNFFKSTLFRGAFARSGSEAPQEVFVHSIMHADL
jgi:hypothetical protein